MAAFMAAIPWNFYAILTIALVVFLIWRGRDFGPMLTAEAEAEKTENLRQDEEQTEPTGNGGLLEMIFPIALLLIFSFAALLYSGGFWSDGPTKYQFGAAIGASSSSSALCWAGFGTLAATILLYVPRRVLSFTKCMDGAVNGMKLMLPANIILVLAWTLSGICRDLLMSAQYVEGLVTSFGGDVMQLFPFICLRQPACFLLQPVLPGRLSASSSRFWCRLPMPWIRQWSLLCWVPCWPVQSSATTPHPSQILQCFRLQVQAVR